MENQHLQTELFKNVEQLLIEKWLQVGGHNGYWKERGIFTIKAQSVRLDYVKDGQNMF